MALTTVEKSALRILLRDKSPEYMEQIGSSDDFARNELIANVDDLINNQTGIKNTAERYIEMYQGNLDKATSALATLEAFKMTLPVPQESTPE